jgi:hypothetical protein
MGVRWAAPTHAPCGTRIYLEKCEEHLRRHSGRRRQGIVPDLQTGTALYELKGMRSDRSHSNYNGSQMKAGVWRSGSKEAHRVRVQTRVRFQRCGFRSPIRARTLQEPESKGEPDLLWTPESEPKGEPDLLWTREPEPKEESDLLWTRESESKGESDLLWTRESESKKESDLLWGWRPGGGGEAGGEGVWLKTGQRALAPSEFELVAGRL